MGLSAAVRPRSRLDVRVRVGVGDGAVTQVRSMPCSAVVGLQQAELRMTQPMASLLANIYGGVSGLRSGVDVISDARAAAAQHKQWRAQQTGGGIASRQQLHARTNGGNGRARIHSSCSSGGGGGSYSCHRPPHHWRRGAARSASRLTPADWAHAPRGAAGDLICSNPP